MFSQYCVSSQGRGSAAHSSTSGNNSMAEGGPDPSPVAKGPLPGDMWTTIIRGLCVQWAVRVAEHGVLLQGRGGTTPLQSGT